MTSFDFRAAQESARRASTLLVLGFLAMVLAIGAAIGILGAVVLDSGAVAESRFAAVDPAIVLGTAGAVIVNAGEKMHRRAGAKMHRV